MTPAVMAVVVKEFRQITRDRRMLGLLIGAPALQLFVLGYAVNLDVDRVETVVCDHDRTPLSRELASAFLADGTFVDVGEARDCVRPEDDLRDGIARTVLVLPAGLARDVAAGRSADVQVLVDGSNPVIGRYAATAAESFLALRSAALLRPRLETLTGLQGVARPVAVLSAEPRVFYNPRLKTAIFMVPGVSALLLLVVATLTTAMALAREREMGTLEQVLVTPIRRWELLVGKVVPFVLIGLFDTLLAFVVGAYVFDVPIRGSLALLFLGALLYLMSTVALGLLISTFSRTQQQAILGGFFVMMPALLLSGVVTPVTGMPSWLRPIAYVNPVKYFADILRGVMLKGSDLPDLAFAFIALAVLGSALLAISTARFRKRLS